MAEVSHIDDDAPRQRRAQRSTNDELSSFVVDMFHHLGGRLTVDDDKINVFLPKPAFFRLQDMPIPQFDDAELCEQFHSDDEWKGALKVLAYAALRLRRGTN